MKVLQISKFKSRVFVVTVLTLAVGFVSSSFAVESSSTAGTSKSKAVQGIESMCVEAADGIARQPEAETKILGLLRDGFANIKKRKDGSAGIPEAIGVIRGSAITGVARQPEAEGKITSLVEECEAALDGLKGIAFPF